MTKAWLIDSLRLPLGSRVAHNKGRFYVEKGKQAPRYYHKGPMTLVQALAAAKYLEHLWK